MFAVLAPLSLALLFSLGASATESAVADLVQQWAPRVWMHKDEKFYPYNVSNYLTQVTPTLVNCSTCRYPSDTLPTGTASYGYYLISNEDRDLLLSNTSSFFYGSNPSEQNSALHAFVSSCNSSSSHFVVTYWFMYGFDQGKAIMSFGSLANLPIFKELNKYLGAPIGSHVGDLERMALEIKDGLPVQLFLSVHGIGVYYDYDSADGNFKFNHSKVKGIQEVEDAPKTLQLFEGHPVIYSAKGSHGVWAAKGSYSYTKLRSVVRFLADECSEGVAWDTWQDVQVHYLADSSTVPDWFEYLGYWGNPGGDCVTIPIVDEKICEYGDGPPPLGSRAADITCS